MQIYTRTGDHGTTRIIGGSSKYKDDAQIEAYGTVDELNSYLGLLAANLTNFSDLRDEIYRIQHYLFDCGNDLATPPQSDKYPYRMDQSAIDWLESRIDEYANIPPVVEHFILPGGDQAAAMCHIARTITRRTERRIVTYFREVEGNKFVQKFINRLSDYLFALARLVNHKNGHEDILYDRGGKVFHTDLTKDRIPK